MTRSGAKKVPFASWPDGEMRVRITLDLHGKGSVIDSDMVAGFAILIRHQE